MTLTILVPTGIWFNYAAMKGTEELIKGTQRVIKPHKYSIMKSVMFFKILQSLHLVP